MYSIFSPQSHFSHETMAGILSLLDLPDLGAIASALAVGAAVGACLPPMCEALATAALRSIGDETHSSSPDRRITLVTIVLCALVCGLCAGVFGVGQKGFAAFALSSALLVGAVIDVRYRLLPDIVTAPLLWIGLLANTRGLFVPLPDAVLGAIAGYLGMRAISCLASIATGSRGIGHGDFKLLAALGAWLGWAELPAVLVIAGLSSIFWSLSSARGKRLPLRESMAFGPFLALGGLVGVCLSAPGVYVLLR